MRKKPISESDAALMTMAEVQQYLKIKSRKTLLKYIRTGMLQAVKMGGTRWRISRKAVTAFMDRDVINGAPL